MLAAALWRSPPAPATTRRHPQRLKRLPPPDQPVDPPSNGPADPAEDTLTQAQTDFDDALKSARERLAGARADATDAANAAAEARTDDAKALAQDDIEDARDALDAAVDAAKALAELYSDPGRLGGRAIFVEAAEAARIEDLAKLHRAEARTGWAGDMAAATIPPLALAEVAVLSRTLRKDDSGADAATLLKAADIPPVMHAPGKSVIGGDLGSSGDRLPMRGMPILYFAGPWGSDTGHLSYGFAPVAASVDSSKTVVTNIAAIRNNRPDLVAGLRITSDGLIVNLGGKGATGTDFRSASFSDIYPYTQALRPVAGIANSGQGTGYDLTLGFGRPSAPPEGGAWHFWSAGLEPSAAQVTAAVPAVGIGSRGDWLRDGDRTLLLGAYQVRLSNHIRFDPNQEDPDADPYPDDDENSYLTYAAYGFMDFLRTGVGASTFLPERGYHRVFPFHVGYDAFRDEAGKRTTDIANAVTATFKGRTMAANFRIVTGGTLGSVFLSDADTVRMRGDIKLTATISGTASDNKVTGRISNMEDWDRRGWWKNSTIIPADIEFHATDGTVDTKGEFTGTFGNYPTGYERGGYRGNFYGPLDSLEAAGTWAMNPASSGSRAIAGSFGAAIVREDGTFGRVVPVGN